MYICLHVLYVRFMFSLSLPPYLPPPKGMTALLSQLPLMMDPCFAAKFLGDLKSSIKMEWEKAIERGQK